MVMYGIFTRKHGVHYAKKRERNVVMYGILAGKHRVLSCQSKKERNVVMVGIFTGNLLFITPNIINKQS